MKNTMLRIAIIIIIAVFEIVNTSDINRDRDVVLYPRSIPNLIFEFYHNYKHIKQLTLFLCDNGVGKPSFESIFSHTDVNSLSKHQELNNDKNTENRYLNFQQITKYLMASAKFLIKGVGNIDETILANSNGENIYEPLDSMLSFHLIDVLKCGDFKHGIVLDLRCQQSQYILQQVKQI